MGGANSTPGKKPPPSPIWAVPGCTGQLADSFIQGTELEGGGAAHSLSVISIILGRVLMRASSAGAGVTPSHPQLSMFGLEEFQFLAETLKIIKASLEIGKKQGEIKKPEDLAKFLEEWQTKLEGMKVGNLMLVPGGWVGKNSQGTVMHIIEKTAPLHFSFVTCNVGEGLQYHPSSPASAPKMKYRASIKFENIPAIRMLDPGFWSMFFAMWLKAPPVEFHRVEVLYDVLLPWLAGELLPAAIRKTANDSCAAWRTRSRAGTSAHRSVLESLRYILCHFGLSFEKHKQLTLSLRRQLLDMVHEELRSSLQPLGRPFSSNSENYENNNSDIWTKLVAATPDSVATQLNSADYLKENEGTFILVLFASPDSEVCKAAGSRVSKVCAKINADADVAAQAGAVETEGRRRAKVLLVPTSLPPDSTSQGLSESEFQRALEQSPSEWWTTTWQKKNAGIALRDQFGVDALPAVVVVALSSPNNSSSVNAQTNDKVPSIVQTNDGYGMILRDPQGKGFPWTVPTDPKAPAPPARRVLSRSDEILIKACIENVSLTAVKSHRKQRLSDGGLKDVHAQVDELLGALSEGYSIPTASTFSHLTPAILPETEAKSQPYSRAELLLVDGEEKYAGETATKTPIEPCNILDVPAKVDSFALAMAAMIRCEKVCDSLLKRGREKGGASRLVQYYQVIQLISQLFTETLPMPIGCPIMTGTIWADETLDASRQLRTLELVYRLMLTYGATWQAMEWPCRAFDSERCLVAGCMLAVFDAVMRRTASDAPMVLSLCMMEDGGYYISTDVCQKARSFRDAGVLMELLTPSHARVRCAVLDYFASVRRACKIPLFQLRTPNDIEVKKYGSTAGFVRKMIERCGYELIPLQHPNPPPEFEALMEWLANDGSKLNREHPEFKLMRDVSALFRFLATMETREAEQMRRKTTRDHYVRWNLSFDENSNRSYRRRVGLLEPLRWEILRFRGVDKTTADVNIFCFGGRKLFWGEGPVVQSPALVDSLTGVEACSEDDVLYCRKLPTWEDTLSREESELLLSYLTVPYARIPLVLNFFASHDRVTYLFNTQLQSLFRAVIFEQGPWASPKWHDAPITAIPLRRTALQKREEIARVLLNGSREKYAGEGDDERLLGVPWGLLCNELSCSPKGTLVPFISMLSTVIELGGASVYSKDASFILYLIELSIGMEAYVVHLIYNTEGNTIEPRHVADLRKYRAELSKFLRVDANAILLNWLEESEREEDVPTTCVVHTYLAQLWCNMRCPEELDVDSFSRIIGSLSYVHNWHGFGQGVLRSQLENAMEDPEQRLMRFLQAQGIDTKDDPRMSREGLKQYLNGKPLYLHIGGVTIRAPTFKRSKDNKLPPVDLPEDRIFAQLQQQRRGLVSWFDSQSSEVVDIALNRVIRTALKTEGFEHSGWKRQGLGTGRYTAESVELTVDLQAAEVLWRNEELQPVPDSMTEFRDFATIFGREPMQCGVVARQQHRLWVRVVGTGCDLIEWDAPKPDDQGAGCPTVEVETSLNLGWSCEQCTLWNSSDNSECVACGHPKPPAKVVGITHNGISYTRPFDIYFEGPIPGLSPAEKWVEQLLRPLLLEQYPEDPEDKKMTYTMYLPTTPLKSDDGHVTLIGCDAPAKHLEDTTWKEITILKERQLVQVFNLVSHGRRMRRSLVYASDTRFCLHSIPVELSPRSALGSVRQLYHAGGDFKKRINGGPDATTLVIERTNREICGKEQYLPPRLVQGVIPTVLLESFRLWLGEDGIVRGEMLDDASQWFNYKLEIDISPTGAFVRRRPAGATFNVVKNPKERVDPQPSSFELHDSGSDNLSHNNSRQVFSEANIMTLVTLGYSPDAARLALGSCAHSLERAASWLMDPVNAAAIAIADGEDAPTTDENENPSIAAPALVRVSSHLGRVLSLEKAGFATEVAEYALAMFNDDSVLAEAWLADKANATEIARLQSNTSNTEQEKNTTNDEEKVSIDGTVNTSGVVLTTVAPASVVGSDLILLNLLDAGVREQCGDEDVLYRLASLLVRIEDLSHILVWTTSTPPTEEKDSNSSLSRIAVIELPRMKLRFQPSLGVDNKVRLYLLGQDGWFVSESVTSAAGSCETFATRGSALASDGLRKRWHQISELLNGIDNSLLLENHSNQFQILVANHDLHRPRVKGHPFTVDIACDRSSFGWQTVMQTRYYLYPVHTSAAFLLRPTLSSTLYLVLLRFLSRNYEAAFKLACAVSTDVSFTAEEDWIWQQLSRAKDDCHPDAHAVRLKLTLAVIYSSNKLPWDVDVEVIRYLTKLPHVSATCRIMAEEELAVLRLARNGSVIIKNRIQVLQALSKQSGGDGFESSGSENGSVVEVEVELKPSLARWGGQPWYKLQQYSVGHLDATGSSLKRLHYKRPHATGGLIDGADCCKLVWDCLVMADEESGSNRQLGILFLYEVLRGRLKLKIVPGGADVSQSLGELLTRAFHLKLSRWGRETTEDGEQETRASKQMAALAALLAHPTLDAIEGKNKDWPDVPEDRRSASLLRRGVNIYVEGLRTPVKTFIEQLDNAFARAKSSPAEIERQNAYSKLVLKMREDPLSIKSKVSSRIVLGGNSLSSTAIASVRNNPAMIFQKRSLEPSDTGCSMRNLRACSWNVQSSSPSHTKENNCLLLSDTDLKEMSSQPLGGSLIGLDNFITYLPPDTNVSPDLPFDLNGHEAALPMVAREILTRMAGDKVKFTERMSSSERPFMRGLESSDDDNSVLSAPSSSKLKKCCEDMEKLLDLLHQQQCIDSAWTASAMFHLKTAANNADIIKGQSKEIEMAKRIYLLRRCAQQEEIIDFEFLAAILLSSSAKQDVSKVNRFAKDPDSLIRLVSATLLRSSRVLQANRSAAQIRSVIKAVAEFDRVRSSKNSDDVLDGMWAQLLQKSSICASVLSARRHYFRSGDELEKKNDKTQLEVKDKVKDKSGVGENKGNFDDEDCTKISLRISGKWRGVVTIPANVTVGALRLQLQNLSGIACQYQKLIIKGKTIRSDNTQLSSLGLKNQSRVMLMATRHSPVKVPELNDVPTSSSTSSNSVESSETLISENSKVYSYDPRFLVFEFLFDILLYERQVEMVEDFVAALKSGSSRVQQMIMGAGKTTTVAPLLALIMADGQSLVMQTMPTALLEQTRNVMRQRFSTILVKRVLTLDFDRSWQDSAAQVALLQAKLDSCRRHRDVVCAAPEAIKCFVLKFIELLHSTEQIDFDAIVPTDSLRHREQMRRMREKMQNKSDMCDALVPILHMWKSGVLIMDEVDVLLHPLRSELNFPIGQKQPIDLSGPRWDLPIDLLDAIVVAQSVCRDQEKSHVVSMDDAILRLSNSSVFQSDDSKSLAKEVMSQFVDAIHDGYSDCALQRNPHMVLLDKNWYCNKLRPVVARWTLLWLQRNWSEGKDEITGLSTSKSSSMPSESELISFLCGDRLFLRPGMIEKYYQNAKNASLDDAASILLKLSKTWDVVRLCPKEMIHNAELLEDITLLDVSDNEDVRSIYADISEIVKSLRLRASIDGKLKSGSKKLLNLASEWVQQLMPHCLSKIDRVSFGILSATDMENLVSDTTPLSRRLMAVPFIGKDVPSRSSEFAHPDVVIGLTILAYRYEGVRLTDLRLLITQLKQDFSREVGPRAGRPSSRAFRSWLSLTPKPESVLPLQLFQPGDPKQMAHLWELVHSLPQLIHYYLRQHVFPACMNFQETKISACGHELGSNILFGRRVGFSGTPSNLLPDDLGTCLYEPGSDGKILHTLCSPLVTTAQIKPAWSAMSLLRDVAAGDEFGCFHALIDTGALITGMDNEQAARFLLLHLPAWAEGVVYLDRRDRKMVLERVSGRVLPLAQCGIRVEHRFTFYDQVHTTGMDIKQCPSARAVVTIGKDMTFRDYAQGAFRMRGIGKGQRIKLYIIPEVEKRIAVELGADPKEGEFSTYSGKPELDVPAWLLLNSMKLESLQFVQLCVQELRNIWRRRSLDALIGDVDQSRTTGATSSKRLRRFVPLDSQEKENTVDTEISGIAHLVKTTRIGSATRCQALRRCVDLFREPVDYVVDDHVPSELAFDKELLALVDTNKSFVQESWERKRIKSVIERVSAMTDVSVTNHQDRGFDTHRVQENEQQQQQEKMKDIERDVERIQQYTRDDEQHNAWSASLLAQNPRCDAAFDVDDEAMYMDTDDNQQGEEPFYELSKFSPQKGAPKLPFPPQVLLTDNFFRPSWSGLGPRKLKNIGLVMEWLPRDERAAIALGSSLSNIFSQMTASNKDSKKPNDIAAEALIEAISLVSKGPKENSSINEGKMDDVDKKPQRLVVAMSLAEGETIRRIIHAAHPVCCSAAIAIRTRSGVLIDSSVWWKPEVEGGVEGSIDGLGIDRRDEAKVALQCLRFLDNEMYYTDHEVELLMRGLSRAPVKDRLAFFSSCMRLRRRQRHLWRDTPLAKALTVKAEWGLMKARALLEQFNAAIDMRASQLLVASRLDPLEVFRRFLSSCSSSSGIKSPRSSPKSSPKSIQKPVIGLGYVDMQRCLASMSLGFSPQQCLTVSRLADINDDGVISEEEFKKTFHCPAVENAAPKSKKKKANSWRCLNCTYKNSVFDQRCAICSRGVTGMREPSDNEWSCENCSFFNPKTDFYCSMCNTSRSDYASVRF